jgi:hypothetical protein
MSIYFFTEFFKYFFRVLHEARGESLAGHLPNTLYILISYSSRFYVYKRLNSQCN